MPITVKELSEATKKDAEVRRLMDSLRFGRKCESVDSFRIDPTEFSLQQGCLLRGIRVYVPKPLRAKVIHELHSGHFGVSKMKSLTRAYCWWKNFDKDIEEKGFREGTCGLRWSFFGKIFLCTCGCF